jgi:cell wall-associated NlpC family hydrolase
MPRALPLLLGALALAAFSTGCASTGAVPKPFPGAGAAAAPLPVHVPRSGGSTPALNALLQTALDLRGIAYRNGGADPEGFDCSGFTLWVFGRHGHSLPRAVRDQFGAGVEVELADVAAGDLLFFSTTGGGATHVAISLGGSEFVHAPSSTGVVRVERLTSSYWSSRYVGARRIVLM